MGSFSISYYGGFDDHQEPHFLDSCSLCSKPLHNSDIYMYRGNTPYCSKECRQEQIDVDEAKEKKKWKTSKATVRSSGSKPDRDNMSTTSNKTVQTGTVSVA